jgi:hypothetical protein
LGNNKSAQDSKREELEAMIETLLQTI